MVSANGRYPESVIFSPENRQPWMDEVCNYLSQAGHPFYTVSSMSDAVSVVQTHGSVAILAFACEEGVAFLKAARRKKKFSPTLILIAEQTDTLMQEVYWSVADFVLPPEPVYIERYLQRLLKLQQENTHLKNRCDKLEHQTDDLKNEITAYKRTSSEIELLKNAIVRNVSHELKTPLLQVKSAVALIAEDIADKKLTQYATDATARLETLVRNITMLGSSLEINPGLVIVRDAVEYARRNLGRVWTHRNEGTRIAIDIEDNLPPVKADKQGLSTALQLLMDNALKFSEKEVEVIARRDGNYVLIQVRDYGIGIAHNQLEAIFDSFYQIDSSSTRRYGGMGIGLALVKLILDHHGAKIFVESQVSKGSSFTFKLPAVKL